MLQTLGSIFLALFVFQVYYIWIYYSDIVTYVQTYSIFRYGINIVPVYIDPSTSDYNDTIFANELSKRRCVQYSVGQYSIASNSGYAVSSSSNILLYPDLMSCIVDMTENYSNYNIYNPCLLNQQSADCVTLLSLLK